MGKLAVFILAGIIVTSCKTYEGNSELKDDTIPDTSNYAPTYRAQDLSKKLDTIYTEEEIARAQASSLDTYFVDLAVKFRKLGLADLRNQTTPLEVMSFIDDFVKLDLAFQVVTYITSSRMDEVDAEMKRLLAGYKATRLEDKINQAFATVESNLSWPFYSEGNRLENERGAKSEEVVRRYTGYPRSYLVAYLSDTYTKYVKPRQDYKTAKLICNDEFPIMNPVLESATVTKSNGKLAVRIKGICMKEPVVCYDAKPANPGSGRRDAVCQDRLKGMSYQTSQQDQYTILEVLVPSAQTQTGPLDELVISGALQLFVSNGSVETFYSRLDRKNITFINPRGSSRPVVIRISNQ